MRRQGFDRMIEGDPSLLRLVEGAVIDTHRRWHLDTGRPWTEPVAYRWLRFEDPDPVARLADGLRRLAGEGLEPDSASVAAALAAARRLGYREANSGGD